MLALVDFTDYLVVVNNSLTHFSAGCSAVINQATIQIQNLIGTASGREQLKKLFK